MDLTMISTAEATSVNSFSISCINGDRKPAQIDLDIKKDNKILIIPKKPNFKLHRPRSKEVVATDFRELDNIGIFYCETVQEVAPLDKVTMINNFGRGMSRGQECRQLHTPPVLTPYLTCNLIIRRDFYTDDPPFFFVENAAYANQGIYSASYVGDSPLQGAWMRLIVRGMLNRWGPYCDMDCPECLNGGMCHDTDGDCICPPGFMGTRCETACREGMFGRNCQESCGLGLDCKGLRFCLPDPYGCSCASGWFGRHCEMPCHNDMYGPDCRLSCKCQNGGVCNRFSGCQCPTGWRGQHCEKSDRAPQILEMGSSLEWNLNSSPKILCSATGNPLPSHTSIELRKLDSTVLKVGRQEIVIISRHTAQFEIPCLSAEHAGLWECRVSTNGGQDSRKFNLTVKEPPVPTTRPKLLEKRSKQLVVLAMDSYRGDGPIISTKLLYKPMANGDSWSSIIGDDREPITLMNLKPSTRYHVRVQLTRPGEGGEGAPGPEAMLETDCPENILRPWARDLEVVF
uniref:Tyrosine kinase with immunoglobulin-like and EGF-like domains 1 n=1 Tax=Myripristis murdjan TaxID=586833 RepID=A0A668AWF6_9TELE